MDVNNTIKVMKTQRSFNQFINDKDYLSFTRSGRFLSITVIYDMKDQSRKMIETYDSRSWNEIIAWIHERFKLNWSRKRPPQQVKFLL